MFFVCCQAKTTHFMGIVIHVQIAHLGNIGRDKITCLSREQSFQVNFKLIVLFLGYTMASTVYKAVEQIPIPIPSQGTVTNNMDVDAGIAQT